MTDIHDLTVTELTAAIRAGEVSPVQVTDHYLDRIDRLNEQVGAFYTVTGELAREQAAVAEQAVTAWRRDGERRRPAAAHRRAGPDQGPEPGGRGPDDARQRRVRRSRAGRGRLCRDRAAVGRDRDHREDRDAGVRAALLHRDDDRPAGPDALGPDPLGRRVQRRGRRGGGGRPRARGPGQRRRRLDPDPGQRVRAVRDQADARPDLGRPAQPRPGRPVHQRPAGPHGGGRGAAARRHDRQLPGRHVHPAAAARGRDVPAARDPRAGRLRIARSLSVAVPGAEVHPDCIDAWEAASTLLASLGHEVTDIDLPFGEDTVGPFITLWYAMATLVPVGPDQVGQLLPLTQYLRGQGMELKAADLLFAQAYLQAVTRGALATLNQYDAILTPTLATPPVPVGYFDEVDPAENFERQKRFTPWTALYNASGQPAVSVPLHWTDAGLPIGVMLAGRMGDEATLISLSAQLEAAAPWRDRRPLIW